MRRSGLLGSPPLLSVRAPNVSPALAPLWMPLHHQAPTLRQVLLSPLRRDNPSATASARLSSSTATTTTMTMTTFFLHLAFRSHPSVFVAPRMRLRRQCLQLRMLHTTISLRKTSFLEPDHLVTNRLRPSSHQPHLNPHPTARHIGRRCFAIVKPPSPDNAKKSNPSVKLNKMKKMKTRILSSVLPTKPRRAVNAANASLMA